MRVHSSPLSLVSSALLLSGAPIAHCLAARGLIDGLGQALGTTVTTTTRVLGLDSLLAAIGISPLNPLLSVVEAVLAGDGFVQGVLGIVQGALGTEATYDYVVVGGGTAGNTIGYRLAQAGHSVAIVEAGIFYEIAKPALGTTPGGDIIGIGTSMLDSIPTVDWGFQTEPQAGANNRQIHYARGKCLGGSSALNFMIYHRGTTGTYDMWAKQVGDDSYKFASFLPYFENSVNMTPPNLAKRPANVSSPYDASVFISPGGPVQVGYTNYVSAFATWFEKGMQGIGINRTTGFNSGSLLGYHYTQSTIRNSDSTRSSSTQYIYQAVNQSMTNLKVYTQTLAKRIVFDSSAKATGVMVSSLGVSYTIHASKEVIVSAGAFQSPQLLMVSGVGPKATLNQFNIPVVSDLPGVGQNMWDHIFFGPSYQVNVDTLSRVIHDPVVLTAALVNYATNGTGPLSSNVAEFLGWEKLPQKYRQTWSASTQAAMAQFPDDWPEVEHIAANGFLGNFTFPALQQPADSNQYATNLGAMVAPVSRGNITIRSADMADAPIINPNWLTAKADQEVAISWFKRQREVWATNAMKSISIGQEYFPGANVASDADILTYIQNSVMTVWHASCTCKMGQKSDSMAVIDSQARVFGTQGLRVVDASSFPILPPGHPQSTIYALAEKIADVINKSASSKRRKTAI